MFSFIRLHISSVREIFQHTDGSVHFAASGTLPVAIALLRLFMQVLQHRTIALGAAHRLFAPQLFEKDNFFITSRKIHKYLLAVK